MKVVKKIGRKIHTIEQMEAIDYTKKDAILSAKPEAEAERKRL